MSIYELYWEPDGKGGARLLRAFGQKEEVILPAWVERFPLTEIGSYCFAENRHLPKQYEKTEAAETDLFGSRRELSGAYLKKLVLPDTVCGIGNLSFYNCKSLQCLELPGGLEKIGSDTFMNCHNLHNMTLRCGIREKNGLRQILSQISWELEVTFCGKNGTEAVLFFPEFYENYDEIAPAHVFGRNIVGEGFRARQCFKDDKVDFIQYDTIFPKACAEETAGVLCRIAMDRLRYPVDLADAPKELYEDYIRLHAEEICLAAIRVKDTEPIQFLCKQNLISCIVLEQSICQSAEADWAEGAAYMHRLKAEFFGGKSGSRYVFDDF